MELPTFLNAEYIEEALTKAYAGEVQLKDCEIKLVSANGDNFCSDIYRANVKFVHNGLEEKKSLILKVLIPKIADIGSNEHAMYEKVLPVMESYMKEIEGLQGEGGRYFKAGCLMIDRDDKEVYVLEDLTSLGYHVADRWIGLDEPHAMLLMDKLGKYHAASMIFCQKQTATVVGLKKSHFSDGASDELGNAIAIGGMKHALSIVKTWPNFEDIAYKMDKILATFNERIKAIVDPRKSKVRVLNHGDLWVNNFLYSYNERGIPNDVLFVDFQSSYLGSPGYDINYFLNTSLRLDVVQTKRYELQRVYYNALRTTLEAYGHPKLQIPSWQTIMEEIRNTELFGYYAAVCELPLCCMSRQVSIGVTVDTFTDANAIEQKRKLMYEEQRVVETLRYSLDRFNELRVLD